MEQAWLHVLALHPSASAQHHPYRDGILSKSEKFLKKKKKENINFYGGDCLKV